MPRPRKTEIVKKGGKKFLEKDSLKAEEKDSGIKIKIKKKKPVYDFKLFNKWNVSEVNVSDVSLQPYINLSPVLVPRSHGRNIEKQFWKSKKNIVERLLNKLMVAGHKGKKHWRTSNINTGKTTTIYKIIINSFNIIESKTKKNPVQVFVDALCKACPKEGIATIEYGGVRYPKAVDISPQRRIDLALRWISQGAYASSANAKTKKTIQQALADEIMLAAQRDQKSNCVTKTIELERQAAASR